MDMLSANSFRIGHGYDVHRLVPGRRLILGGVDIPWDRGLLGHSDADVLVHAVMDALRTLDETARACLLMRVVLDLPYRNIALALNIPEGTAASHVHRARATMRSNLNSHRGPRGGTA